MMDALIKELHEGSFSCVIAKGEVVRTFSRRGVADLYDLLGTEADFLEGASVADKVVGKGAAALMAAGKVREVYTDLISQGALDVFHKAGVKVQYERMVPYIENRDKTDWCPLEKSCKGLQEVTEILPVIDRFIATMRGKPITL